jgi:hypothetical protein
VCVELATPKIDLAFEGETIDSWHGFKRHKFSYDGQEAWVVESKSPRAVLDYQSWPGGKGKGKGSPGDWQELRKWYGFESDEQAADYPQTPLKTLLRCRNPGDSPRDRMDQSRQREVLAHRSARHRRLSLGSYLLTDGSRSVGSFCRNGSSGSDA